MPSRTVFETFLRGTGLLCAAALLQLALAAPTAGSGDKAAKPQLPPAVVELQRAALAGTGAAELARSLAGEAGPRFAGSAGLARGVAWGLRTLTALGFEGVRAEAVMVPRWERGTAEGEILAPFPQRLSLAALGGSIGTPEAGIEAEVVATENLESLAALAPETVQGRIVYLGERMQRTHDGSGYGKTVAIRWGGAMAAAKLGAVAVLIRSVGTDANRLPHTGSMGYEDAVTKIPAAALAMPDADLLEQAVASGRPVRFRLRLTSRMLPEVESANVVGELARTREAGGDRDPLGTSRLLGSGHRSSRRCRRHRQRHRGGPPDLEAALTPAADDPDRALRQRGVRTLGRQDLRRRACGGGAPAPGGARVRPRHRARLPPAHRVRGAGCGVGGSARGGARAARDRARCLGAGDRAAPTSRRSGRSACR